MKHCDFPGICSSGLPAWPRAVCQLASTAPSSPFTTPAGESGEYHALTTPLQLTLPVAHPRSATLSYYQRAVFLTSRRFSLEPAVRTESDWSRDRRQELLAVCDWLSLSGLAGINWRWLASSTVGRVKVMACHYHTQPTPHQHWMGIYHISKGYTKAWPTTWGEQFHIPIKRNFEFSGLEGVIF